MLLLGHLAKIQGLKGEFLMHELMDEPAKLPGLEGLILAPPSLDLEHASEAAAPARVVKVRSFRLHQERACVAFEGIPDRTASEAFKGWALWLPEALAELPEGESYRHDWVGCEVFVAGARVGEVLRLEPTPMGYDMVVLRDLRPGRSGQRDVPYIKAWFQVDLAGKRIELDPPPGLLDLDLDHEG
jgi:16S rRNA processing protein RimM